MPTFYERSLITILLFVCFQVLLQKINIFFGSLFSVSTINLLGPGRTLDNNVWKLPLLSAGPIPHHLLGCLLHLKDCNLLGQNKYKVILESHLNQIC